MRPRRKNLALLSAATTIVLGLAPSSWLLLRSRAQATQPPSTMNHAVIVLDPAHGGPDAGAKLGDQLLEKDVNLALAARLRATLTAAGFTVVSTRDADLLTALTSDQRAEVANRAHAMACVVIHATPSGSGVHLYTSTLTPREPPEQADEIEGVRPPFSPTPWETAQADSVRQSLHLEAEMRSALSSTGLPVAAGRATVSPLDNLMCPAVAVEVSPGKLSGGDTSPVSDPGYQQRVADGLTHALESVLQAARTAAAAATDKVAP